MSDKKQNIMLRYIIVCAVMGLAMVGIIARIIIIQTTERDKWLAEAAKQSKRDVEVEPNRGNIYACDGRLLASSLPTYYIDMDPCTNWYMEDTSKMFNKYIDTIADGLGRILPDQPVSYYRNLIVNAHNRGDRWVRLHKTAISYQQLQQVRKLKPFCWGKNKGGLTWNDQKKRKQPFGSLASRTLGRTATVDDPKRGIQEGDGITGMELYYNDLLKGKPGLSVIHRVAAKDNKEIVVPAVDGCDIYTTLDIDLLDITEYALHKQLKYCNGEWGCAVLMETSTGEIKAIANLKRAENGTYYEGENYAAQAFEPGSTFKTLSLMAALDDGLFDLDDTIQTGNGEWVYKDKKSPIHDTHEWGTINVKKALTVSSNVALAKIITKGYKDNAKKFVGKLEDMGLTEPINISIPGAHNVTIAVPEDKETLAHMAFGYSVMVPPIYTMSYYNAIANNGVMVEPRLVREIRQGTETIHRYETNVLSHQICKSSTLEDIRECLESVVWDENGTARAAQSDTVHIAGKTGTARVLVNGKYTGRHRVSFCGFFPYNNPQYTCICVISRPQVGGAGSLCGRVVREIAEHTMAIKGTVPIEMISRQPDEVLNPNIKPGPISATKKSTRHISIKTINNYTDSTDWVKADHDMNLTNIEVLPYFVPNVIGMGAKDAVYAIEQTGMRVHMTGMGRVVKQSVTAGRPAQPGGTVYIELR